MYYKRQAVDVGKTVQTVHFYKAGPAIFKLNSSTNQTRRRLQAGKCAAVGRPDHCRFASCNSTSSGPHPHTSPPPPFCPPASAIHISWQRCIDSLEYWLDCVLHIFSTAVYLHGCCFIAHAGLPLASTCRALWRKKNTHSNYEIGR